MRNPAFRLASAFAALVLTSTVSSAQVTEVRGRVFDALTGEALPYVNVVLGSGENGTMTDAQGQYTLATAKRPGRLSVTFLGYASQSFAVVRGISQQINISLEPRSFDLGAAEVRPNRKEENPAKPLLQRIIEAKPSNNPAKLSAGWQRIHTRIEVDFNDIEADQADAWYWGPFGFVFDYMHHDDNRSALPVVFGEIIADEEWQTQPKRKTTHVLASQVSGDFGSGGDLAAASMNSRFPEINLYDNQLLMLDRVFTSPLHDRANSHYRFYILDTLDYHGRSTFHMAFMPRRKGEMTFEGEMWVDTLTMGLARVEAQLSPSANINFARGMQWSQSYRMVPGENGKSRWMLDADSVVFDMSIAKRSFGAYLRRTSSISEQRWSEAGRDTALAKGRSMTFDSLAILRTDAQWNRMRTVPLLDTEAGIFEMTDSIMSLPQWRFVKSAGYFLGSGFLLAGPLEVGAWWSAYTRNPTEGNRFRLDLQTSNAFSTRFMPSVFAAYGTYDQRWKAGVAADLIFRKTPRTEAFFEIKHDIEQFGMVGLLEQGEAFTSVLRTDTVNLLSEVFRSEASIMHEFGTGFTAFFEWRHRRVGGRGEWNFLNPETGLPIERLITTEATGALRFAKGERFVGGEFVRRSLGTEWPVLDATVTWAMPNVLGSQYNYTRCTLEAYDEVRLGWWGRMEWLATAGKYFGTAPFPLMEVVPASGTFFMTEEAFNMLRLFERVTDEWVSANIEWHGEGILFNHLPLLRQLELREVIGVKGIAGNWDTRHEALLELPEETTGLNGTYSECSVGLENIFGVLRVDGVWRTDLPLADPASRGIRLGFSVGI